jgi:hypothetical protein
MLETNNYNDKKTIEKFRAKKRMYRLSQHFVLFCDTKPNVSPIMIIIINS